MSRTISQALKTHLAGETTTLAHLWLVTLTNGAILAFTDHDQDIVYSGRTYQAATGFTASNVSTTSALNVDNLEVQGMLSSPAITEIDLIAGVWDYATITLNLVNYADLTMGAMYLRSGTLGQVKAHRSNFIAELRGAMQPLQQNLLEIFSPACRASLGDARCKISLAAYTVSGSVTGAISNRAWYDTALTRTNSVTQKAITGISQANPAMVTCVAHGFTTGQQIAISGVNGMTQINGHTATVTFSNANLFSINIDTSVGQGYSAYTSGGTATLLPASEYFQGGIVAWQTGLNAGTRSEVKTYSIGYVELFISASYAVNVGDTYTLVAGCDKALSTCSGRFNNVVNFRGEPHVPGMDALMQHGTK